MHTSLIFTMLERPLAYLDPVSGGAILQVLLGILLVITLFVRAFWRKVKSFFAWISGKSIAEQNKSVKSSEQIDN